MSTFGTPHSKGNGKLRFICQNSCSGCTGDVLPLSPPPTICIQVIQIHNRAWPGRERQWGQQATQPRHLTWGDSVTNRLTEPVPVSPHAQRFCLLGLPLAFLFLVTSTLLEQPVQLGWSQHGVCLVNSGRRWGFCSLTPSGYSLVKFLLIDAAAPPVSFPGSLALLSTVPGRFLHRILAFHVPSSFA